VTLADPKGVNETLAALRLEIEALGALIDAAETGPDESEEAAVVEARARKAQVVLRTFNLVNERHAWREKVRAHECRKRRVPFVPQPQPSFADLWGVTPPEPRPHKPLFPGTPFSW
jgi:hypothetical protein